MYIKSHLFILCPVLSKRVAGSTSRRLLVSDARPRLTSDPIKVTRVYDTVSIRNALLKVFKSRREADEDTDRIDSSQHSN